MNPSQINSKYTIVRLSLQNPGFECVVCEPLKNGFVNHRVTVEFLNDRIIINDDRLGADDICCSSKQDALRVLKDCTETDHQFLKIAYNGALKHMKKLP